MSSNDSSRSRLTDFLGLLNRLSATVGAIIEQRVTQVAAIERREVHKAASVLALLLLATIFACAAAGFAAAAVLTAFGDEHRVLGASLVAAGFAVLSIIAAALARAGRSP